MKASVALISTQDVTVNNKSNTSRWIPYGILSIGSFLTDKQISTRIINDIDGPDNLDIINSSDPFIVGISCTTPEFNAAITLAEKLHAHYPEKFIILGGIHPSIYYYDIIKKYKSVSAVVVGEGEHSLFNVAVKIANKENYHNINNVITKKNYKNHRIKQQYVDLNEIGFPNYSLIENLITYINFSKDELGFPALHMVSTRGCPHNCFFCSAKIIQGRKCRQPDPERLVKFWKKSKADFNIDGFWLKDSNFTSNWNWIELISRQIRVENLNLNFSINSNLLDYVFRKRGSLVRQVDETRIKVLKKIGVTHIWFGIETGSEKISKTLNKSIKKNELLYIVDCCIKNDILPCGFFMIGFPGETLKEIKETFKLMDTLPLFSKRLHLLQPLPGSKLFNDLGDKQMDTKRIKFSEATISTNQLSCNQLKAIYQEMVAYFYENGPLPSFV